MVVNGIKQMQGAMNKFIRFCKGNRVIAIILFFCSFGLTLKSNAQLVDCGSITTSGYNTNSENVYLEKISKEIQYGCGATWGKQIFFKNNHPSKTIKGFVLKQWKYSGYENYTVCELHYFELKPGQQSNSMGCTHITQMQPCEFTAYGQFIK